uniref:Uncharacterized protein n=1 Tax=Leersia perrieri TaxID=77586 RepID=A0A0D9XAM9_9ORYZ
MSNSNACNCSSCQKLDHPAALLIRRETLLWIILRNRSSAPFSRSPMMHSNACNCSSSQTTDLFFWNALETRDILGTTSCCDRWHDVDSSKETVSTLALINSLTSLQSSLSEVVFLLIFLHCFCAFLTKRVKDWILT